MSRVINETGNVYGEWTVLYRAPNRSKNIMWHVRCSCGFEKDVQSGNLRNGKSTKCRKCASKSLLDIGSKWNSWTILERAKDSNKGKTTYLCRCDCGYEKVQLASKIRSGESKCCKKCSSTTHGMYGSRVYNIWAGMKQRCSDVNCKKYPIYGGRGIYVCNEWERFEPFYEWVMGNGYRDDLTIDRINNDKGYSPSNCRWVTLEEQAINRRDNIVNKDGILYSHIAKENGINPNVMYNRHNIHGWSYERACTEPITLGRRRKNG